MKIEIVVFVCALLLGVGLCRASAQEAPKPPAKTEAIKVDVPKLTEAQKKQITDAAQAQEVWALRLENATLKAQQAQSELDKAKTTLQRTLSEVVPAGYQIGNEKLDLVLAPKDDKK